MSFVAEIWPLRLGRDEQMDKQTKQRKSPCVLQDIVPFEVAAQQGQMDGGTNKQKSPVFYRTSSPLRALPITEKNILYEYVEFWVNKTQKFKKWCMAEKPIKGAAILDATPSMTKKSVHLDDKAKTLILDHHGSSESAHGL